MGLLPLVRGLPVRLTNTVSSELQLYRNRRCTIIGWTLHPDEASEATGSARVLTHMSDELRG